MRTYIAIFRIMVDDGCLGGGISSLFKLDPALFCMCIAIFRIMVDEGRLGGDPLPPTTFDGGHLGGGLLNDDLQQRSPGWQSTQRRPSTKVTWVAIHSTTAFDKGRLGGDPLPLTDNL
jgi:hypothetical protein